MPYERATAAMAGTVVAVALLAACQGEDRAQVAAAKCGMPVSDAVVEGRDAGRLMPRQSDIEVVELGEGRYRVSGLVLVERPRPASPRARTFGGRFMCEVAPDASDDLRGFKVTKLQVARLQPMS